MTMTIIPSTTLDTPETPRSLEVLIEHVRAEIECHWCEAAPGRSCDHQGRRGVHLSRFVHALVCRQITADEIAVIVQPYPEGNFRAATIIRRDRPQPEQLYVVVNVEPGGRRVTVTDPKPRADAARFAEREAPYFAGRLEVAPARPEDLADVDSWS